MMDERLNAILNDYEDAKSWQDAQGYAKKFATYVDFYEGRQWAEETEATKNLPRPVVNVIKLICRSKKAAILASPMRLHYDALMPSEMCRQLDRFSEYIEKEMKLGELDRLAIEDGIRKGSFFYHIYWDAEARGLDGKVDGGVRAELIDPLDIFFANPKESDEQKQKWIIIRSREEVEGVIAKADGIYKEKIVADDEQGDPYGITEQTGSKLVTVYTRYFRRDGEVYYEMATKNTMIKDATMIAPVAGFEKNGKDDGANNSLMDKDGREAMVGKSVFASLYPIAAGYYERRENSIFGIGEVEGLIANQKMINFNLAMMILNAQNMAWGKYIVLPNALGSQTINNKPGQVLTDFSQTGSGIRKMAEPGASNQPTSIIELLTNLTRTVTGSTELMTGEVVGSSMSGAAIAQIQAQAMQPNEELRNNFWAFKAKVGKILCQYFKLYYRGATAFARRVNKEEMQRKIASEPNAAIFEKGESGGILVDRFDGSMLDGIDVEVTVEAVAGTRSSVAGDITILDGLLRQGAIDIETYVKLYPSDAITNKNELIESVEAKKRATEEEASGMVAEYAKKVEELTAIINKQNETVSSAISLINENKNLKAMLLQVMQEGSSKIEEANRQIAMSNQSIEEKQRDAEELAAALYESGALAGFEGRRENDMSFVQSGMQKNE